MAKAIYSKIVFAAGGGAVDAGAEYNVFSEATGLAVDIYEDRNGVTIKTQPAFSDASGRVEFYVDAGLTFRVAVEGGSGTVADRYQQGVLFGDQSGEVGRFSSELGTAAGEDSEAFVATVATIADLPTSAVYGQKVSVNEYHLGTGKGGGPTTFTQGVRHNGGTAFDPLRAAEIGTPAYYVDSGVDADCWVRNDQGLGLFVDDFGAVPHSLAESSPSNSALSINATITVANGLETTVNFGDGIYGYDSDDYQEISSGMRLRGTGDHSTRIYFTGTGGTYRSGTHSNFYFWHSKKERKLTIQDIELRQTDSNYVACIYSCSSTDDFGMTVSTQNAIFSLWQNTGLHVIRGFGVSLYESAFIGTSSYTESTGAAAFALDDANIRIWGADGTTGIQEHSFSDNVSIVNCKLNKAKYQIDGYGVIGEVISSSIEKGYAGIKNVKISGSLTPSSDVKKASGGKASLSIGTGCYFEKHATYYSIDREINETTGAEINPAEVGSDWHFNGTAPGTGGPVEDSGFVGIARHNPELEIKRLSYNTNYLGDLGGGSISNDVNFFYSFQENPAKTWLKFDPQLFRVSIPDARFDGNFKVANPLDTANDYVEISNDGSETVSVSTHNYSWQFTISSAGLELSGSGNLRPVLDLAQNNGSSAQRWASSYSEKFYAGTASNRFWTTGSGTPEGVLTASPGSLYSDETGGAGTTLYVKESGTGNTGWIAK